MKRLIGPYRSLPMARRKGIVRHCETAQLNSDCPYIPLGCLGCTPVQAAIDPKTGRALVDNRRVVVNITKGKA